jgi:hypothetical protein
MEVAVRHISILSTLLLLTVILLALLAPTILLARPAPGLSHDAGPAPVPEPLDEGDLACPTSSQLAGPAAGPVLVAPRQGAWQYGPPSPFQYQRFDAVFVPGPQGEPWADKVYFMGGRISAPSELPDIWMFNPATGVYTDTQANMIEDVSNYNADLILDDGTGRGPAVYVIGGYDKDGGSGGGNLGLVQRYYPQTNVVESLPGADNWPGQVVGNTVGGMGTAVVNDVIYVFGGWESSVAPYFYSGTWTFDPKQPSGSRWTNLGVSLDPGRSYIQTAMQDGKIYAIGGIYQYTGDLVPTDVVEVLDTADVAAGWTAVTSLPVPTAEGRGFGFDDDTLAVEAPWQGLLYLAGGGDWPDISREAMAYDVGADAWDQSFPDLNDRRVNNAGTFVPLCTPDPDDGLPGLWVFGGRSENGCDPPYGATEFYDLPCADCTLLTGIDITGPGTLPAGDVGLYAAMLAPPTATLPVDLLWSNGLTGTSAVYQWAEPGSYTVGVTGTNCAGFAAVTATFEVEVTCVGVASATVAGPETLPLGEVGVYTATAAPPNATEPITFTWSTGQTGPATSYSWSELGPQTVVLTATNCGGAALVTGSLEVDVFCVDLLSVTVSGPEALLAGEAGTYTATVAPPNASAPVDLLWSNGLTGTSAVYGWTVPGNYVLVVTGTNCGGVPVIGTLDVSVSAPMHYFYLPLVVRNL